MERKFIKIWVISLLLLGGCAKPKIYDKSKIVALSETKSFNDNGTLRTELIKQTARGIGAQAALAWQAYHVNETLEKHRRKLDHIFNFNYLILEHNVLPPILMEGKNILNLADDFSLRIADREYQIIQPPRFVTAAPHWRGYIWMPYEAPEKPSSALLPRNKCERNLWNEYIEIGWNDGIEQANQIFDSNLAKLKRDYLGMILYRKLLAQNMVTSPYVSKTDLGITGSGDDMHINDRVLRITSTSYLRTNAKQWRPAATTQGKEKSKLFNTEQVKTLMDKI